MNRINIVVNVLALVAAGIPARASAWGPAPSSADPVELRVAASTEERAAAQKWMREAATAGMADAHVSGSDARPGRTIVIELDGEAYAYTYAVGLRGPDGWIGGAEGPDAVVCKCTADQLVARVRSAVAELAPQLRGSGGPSAAGEPVAATTATAGAVDTGSGTASSSAPNEASAQPTASATRDVARLGPRGGAGAALLGLGSGVLIAGVVMAALPERRRPEAGDAQRYIGTSTKSPGYAFLGVGAAAVITGAVLLALDLRPRKRARRSAQARVDVRGRGPQPATTRGMSWAPMLDATSAGISLGGSF